MIDAIRERVQRYIDARVRAGARLSDYVVEGVNGQFLKLADVQALLEDDTKALMQMADPDQYRAVYESTERHPCPVPDCRLSAEEHHRLSFGLIHENRRLKGKS